MLRMYATYLKSLFASKKGQGMVEYGLIIGLVAVAVIVVLGAMGTQIQAMFQSIVNALTPSSTTTP